MICGFESLCDARFATAFSHVVERINKSRGGLASLDNDALCDHKM